MLLGDALTRILHRERLAQDHCGQHDQQQARIHSQPHTHQRPVGAGQQRIKRHDGEKNKCPYFEDLGRTIGAHPVPDKQSRRDERTSDQTFRRTDQPIEHGKCNERRESEKYPHFPAPNGLLFMR